MVEAFSALCTFSSVTMRDAVNLLLENVLNGKYAYSDWLIKVKFKLSYKSIVTDEKVNKILKVLHIYYIFMWFSLNSPQL